LKYKPIPGFSALKLKEEVQAASQADLKGLSPDEVVAKLNHDAANGPFAEWWKQSRAEQRAAARAKLDQEEREDAA
jgi:hypothetical protein